MKTLTDAFHDELRSERFKATLYTLNLDAIELHKATNAYHNATTEEQENMAAYCFNTLVNEAFFNKTAQPHALAESEPQNRTALTQSPMCGAFARQTGKPCKQPAMRGLKRCRLHGGKSTGRPINHGLRSKAFKQHIKRLKLLGALIAQH